MKKKTQPKTKKTAARAKVSSLSKKTKRSTKALIKRGPRKVSRVFEWGKISSAGRKRILVPLMALNFFFTGVLMLKVFVIEDSVAAVTQKVNPNAEFERQIKSMVKGYPIEQMAPYIAERDKDTAAFLVAIAKKESAWGLHKPVLNGEDCYNYWGFRLKTGSMGSEGHTCFETPKQAVNVVADRIDELVKEEKIDSPKEMVVWKCGYDCNGVEAQGAGKWIKDVDYYYRQLLN